MEKHELHLTKIQLIRLEYILNSGKTLTECCNEWGITVQSLERMFHSIEKKYPGFRYNLKYILKGGRKLNTRRTFQPRVITGLFE